MVHDSLEVRRDGLSQRADRRRLVAKDCRHRLGSGSAVERAPASEHLVDDDAEREDIGAWIDHLAAHLFGRHVADRAHRDTGLGQQGRRLIAGRQCGGLTSARPKSRTLTCPSLVTNRFSGFTSRWMTPFACAAARPSAICPAYSTAFRGADRSPDERLTEHLAIQQLHRDEAAGVGLADVVDGENVWMRQ